jgi:hypothetical protein
MAYAQWVHMVIQNKLASGQLTVKEAKIPLVGFEVPELRISYHSNIYNKGKILQVG